MARRQATGFVESLLRLVGLDWSVPDFSTLSRRQKTLAIKISYRGSKGPLRLVIDSTGIEVEGEGGWHARNPGGPKRRVWRTIHLGIDEETLEIRAVEITGIHICDATVSRFCPAADPRFTCRGEGEDVVQTLERVCGQIGYPRTIRVDNGSEFISRDFDLWAYANDVTLDFSWPGKPTYNGFIEAFNSKLRSECLNAHWFMSLTDAREKLGDWRRHYNEDRPHSANRYNVPIAMYCPDGVTSPSS